MATTTEHLPSSTPASPEPDSHREEQDSHLEDQVPKRIHVTRSKTLKRGLMALAVVLACGGVLYASIPYLISLAGSDPKSKALTSPVTRNKLVITVVEDGNLESAVNLDIKCQIQSNQGQTGGSTILWIIPDGTTVEKGQEIIRLEVSRVEEQLNIQRIAYERARALKIQVEQDLRAAEIAVKEYEQGTFFKELKIIEAQIVVAEENLRTSQNIYKHTEGMARKGYVTPLQLEAQEFGMKKAQIDMEAAKQAKYVLEEFTKEKMLTDLKSKKEAAEAKVRSEEAAFRSEESRLKRMEDQLKKCVIVAPQAGMVVYANEKQGGRGGGSQQTSTIEEGAAVKEAQTMVRLPDLSKMQVKVLVHESKVDRIHPGMPARIRIQDRDLPGAVISVANQAEVGGWMSSSVKEYATIVKIEGEATGLKPGMTAEVEILIAEYDNVLTIPVQSVVEKRGQFFAWVQKATGAPEARQLRVGDSNDKVVDIKDGLVEGELVLLNPLAVVEEARDAAKSSGEKDEKDKFRDQKRYDPSQPAPATAKGAGASGGPGAQAGNAIAGATPSGGGTGPGGPGGGEGGRRQGGGGGGGRPNMADLDKDGDGKISREEAPERMQQFFDRIDTNSDGFLDAAEMAARPRGGGGGGGGGGGRRPDQGEGR